MERLASRTTTPSNGVSDTSMLDPPPITHNGKSFGVGIFNGFNNADTRGRFQ